MSDIVKEPVSDASVVEEYDPGAEGHDDGHGAAHHTAHITQHNTTLLAIVKPEPCRD